MGKKISIYAKYMTTLNKSGSSVRPIRLFIQQVFVEHLLCARLCSDVEYMSEQDKEDHTALAQYMVR